MSNPTRRAARAALLLAAALVALPAPLDAQLGSLLGAPGADASQGAAEGSPVAHSNARSPCNEWVLEMTPEVLDQVEKGLAAESAKRGEVVALLEKQPSREEYERCQQRAVMLPEMQKLVEEYMAELEKAGPDNNAAMKAAQNMEAKMNAIHARECGQVLGDDRAPRPAPRALRSTRPTRSRPGTP